VLKSVLLATLLGSAAAFLVSAAWHMTPALGAAGVKTLPSEDTVLAQLRTAIHEPGLYIFPSPGGGPTVYLAKYEQGPSGILVVKTGGEKLDFPKLLINQYLFGLLGSFLLACILALAAPATTYGQRILTVALVIAFSGTLYELADWNWYGFPALYIASHFAGWVVSWLAAGLLMAKIVKPARVT
jgi:hypothetical protein